MKHRAVVIVIVVLVIITGLPIAAGLIVSHMEDGQTAAEYTVPEPDETIAAEEPEVSEGPEEMIPPDETVTQERKIEVAPPPEPLEKYSGLLEINPYVAGWLEIDGTVIDAPVVYAPGSQNYFLHRAVDGTPSERGTFFIAINWQEGFNNTLIYGHNMKDGSGFGALTAFADAGYGLSHPTIHFDTLYEDREYELYAAFYSQIDEEELETDDARAAADQRIAEKSVAKKQEEAEAASAADAGAETEPPVITAETLTVADLDLHRDFGMDDIYRFEKDEDNGRFRYYYFTDLSDRADFDYFADNVKKRALYDTGVDAEWGDEFVTLSTCSYQVKNGRFVVVGVRHAGGQ